MDIAEFLLARIAEDEAEVGLSINPEAQYGTPWHLRSAARVLAECEAKRGIVALHTGAEWIWDDAADDWRPNPEYLCRTMCLLALPYADHPDYDEAWRP